MANTIEIVAKFIDRASREAEQVFRATAKSQEKANAAAAASAQATNLQSAASVLAAARTFLFASSVSGLAYALGRGQIGLQQEAQQLDNLSVRLGTTTQNIQVLQELMKRQGLGTESATMALQFMSRAIADHNPQLRLLGITAGNAYDALLQLADIFDHSSDTQAKNAISVNLLGRSYGELMAVMPKLRDRLADLRAETTANGQLWSDAQMKQLTEADVQWSKFVGHLEGYSHRAGAAIATFMNRAIEGPSDGVYVGSDAWYERQAMKPTLEYGNQQDLSERLTSGLVAQKLARVAAQKQLHVLTDDERALYKASDDLQKLFGVSADEAYGYATALQALDNEARRLQITQKLWPADRPRDSDRNMIAAGFGGDAPNARGRVRVNPFDQAMAAGEFDPGTIWADQMKRQADEMQRQMERAHESAKGMFSSMAGLAAQAGNQIVSGFANAFASLANHMQTFKGFITSLWDSILRAVLSVVGQIVAAMAIIGLGALIGGGAGSVISSFGWGVLGMPAPKPGKKSLTQVGGGGDAGFAPMGGTVINNYVQAFDTSYALGVVAGLRGAIPGAYRRAAMVSAG